MSTSPQSAGAGAVFLSYASQDAVAARSICDALRAAGVEVWFDQSQLEGGDAWDAKIRRQIAECVLFVPVISAATQARLEGYFRIEWKLAAQRTHAMAEEKTFLLPVVIDATGDVEARVPADFRAVQWTRLPAGQTTPPFVHRVKKLLDAQGMELAPQLTTVHSASPFADDKTVAVLPFANLSGDKEQEYFSDGLTDEILNVLAREPDLRVPGRTSSFSFKGKNMPAPQIARALNVSRLVEGSVQRAGSRVRIRVTLTQVAHGFSESLGSFDRDATDIFALQDEIARAVLEKLTHRTSTSAGAILTKNSAAYDTYLRGRALQVLGPIGAKDSIPFFEKAVALDPTFAMAWARLAAARTTRVISVLVEDRRELPAARAALARALALQPNLPEALMVEAMLARAVDYDFAAAGRSLMHAASLLPATAELRSEQASLARDQGHWTEALQLMREGLVLDPQNGAATHVMAMLVGSRGEFSEADRYWRKTMALQGASTVTAFLVQISNRQWWRGAQAALQLVERFPPAQPFRDVERARLLFLLGRADEARGLVEQHGMEPPSGNNAYYRREFLSLWLSAGKTAEARWLAATMRDEAQAQFDQGHRSIILRMDLIAALLALGERDAAVAQLRAWRRESGDLATKSAWSWMFQYGCRVAPLFARAHLPDEAIETLAGLLAGGFQLGYLLRHNPDYGSCEADPRFQALQKKNEAWADAQPDPAD